MPTEAMIEAAAEAIANARGMRRGVPAITGILAALPSKIHDEVMEDAKAALVAAEAVRRPDVPIEAISFVCGPTCGCGKAFAVKRGHSATCPHCGKEYGVLLK